MDVLQQVEEMIDGDAGTTALGRKSNDDFTATVTPASAEVPVEVEASIRSSSGEFTNKPVWRFKGYGEQPVGETITTTLDKPTDELYVVAFSENSSVNWTIPIDITEQTNKNPVARVSASSSEVTPPASVTFDASDSSDPDNNIKSYEWSFSDGVSRSGKRVSRRFTESDGGSVTGTCTVTDTNGASDSAQTSVTISEPANEPPVAVATATPSSGDVPLDVTFDASNSSDPDGSIRSYQWTLPGGEQATGQTVKRTYGSDNTGELTATVTVTDSDGSSTSDTASVVVTNPPNDIPTANATATPKSGSPPLTVKLSGSASSDPDGTITGYSWTIPGKPSQSGETATVEFTDDDIGTYDITLTVRDNRGATATDTVTVEVVEQQLLPDISDETLAQGAIVGVGLVSSTIFDSE
jgi:PKD repeat protein